MCNEQVPDVIGPCRGVCLRARERCEPLLLTFGFTWPPALDCQRFPARNDHRHMCMEGPPADDDDDDDGNYNNYYNDNSDRSSSSSSNNNNKENNDNVDDYYDNDYNNVVDVDVTRHHNSSRTRKVIVRPYNSDPMKTASRNADVDARKVRLSSVSPSSIDCSPSHNNASSACRDEPCSVWNATSDRVVGVWVTVTAVLCVVSTLFCLMLFCVDTRRFICSERIIVMMACCSAVCSVAVLVST